MSGEEEKTWAMDAETIHNWTQRYKDLPYYADMPSYVVDAIYAAWSRHHNDGTSCGEEAARLKERFAGVLV